ncbi:TIGR04283 family arsenosugar biosynthesis glycosyltransferase [Cyanobacterium stanieri LEGE 03274]|uniref:4,4'-diaponeurosporenoate glycosyltransferase n=1 Tax=Cyanobacterium stanieri LEGE 03274 TaxID=1828756 RepID=A0ABR9V0U3_9CHRO|nr:TIGR04283 family arsenosugar biosynthesis glycosyltransferase [Cyanobacterium stanieri]MBE9221503.1 TIGR04283 family arsenosugar biosynthesis glycosyltransferase [Cyanobacterium stanieri LEGE 03274]
MIYDSKISVIIPVFNEQFFLEKNISFFIGLAKNSEVIFVDGGSDDKTREILITNGFCVILSPRANRGFQMNLGAKIAKGDILLFLHGDTFLPSNYYQEINDLLSRRRVVAGAFNLAIEGNNSLFYFISWMVKVRSHLFSLPYGDQGIFMKKETFKTVGGFSEIAIMEDFAMIKKLQKIGKINIAHGYVTTSARRWQKLGIFKTTLINQIMIIGYYLKINPDQLAKIYRQFKNN